MVVLGLFALGALIVVLWWSRKKRKVNSGTVGTVGTDTKTTEYTKAELDGGGITTTRELDNNQIYELGNQ